MPKENSTPPRKKPEMLQTAPVRTSSQKSETVAVVAAVIRALEDDKFDWRTIPGLARSTGATETQVVNVLNGMLDQLVRATADDGRVLYTTRSHYEKTHGYREKLLSALADKVVA